MNPEKNARPPAFFVVATVHTARGLAEAARLSRRAVGFVELRMDTPALTKARFIEVMPRVRPPILLTARHPAEGGVRQLAAGQRKALLQEFLPRAGAVDVELRSVGAMASVLEQARRRKITRVISFHDFRRTPGLPQLREVLRRARAGGADIVKIATQLKTPGDLAVLLLLQSTTKTPLATMGMGPLGKVSRLVLAAAGSRLNYGYLDKAQVPGQWPALELTRRLEEIMP
jgi:3-dehydroquinate dehydratase-1